MAADRLILFVSLDAFRTSIEERDQPEVRGYPVVVGAVTPNDSVEAVSLSARDFGVVPGMARDEAFRKCPWLIAIPARPDVYAAQAFVFQQVVRRYSRYVDLISDDRAFVDVSDMAATGMTAREIGCRLRDEIWAEMGVPASVGVSTTKRAAQMAAHAARPHGVLVVPPRQVGSFLAKAVLASFPEIGPRTAARLGSRGLRTGSDILSLPLGELEALVGPSVASKLVRMASGVDQRAVGAPSSKTKSVQKTYPAPLGSKGPQEEALYHLVVRLSERLVADGHAAQKIALHTFGLGLTSTSRTVTCGAPAQRPTDLLGVAGPLLDRSRELVPSVRKLQLSAQALVTIGDSATGRQLDLDLEGSSTVRARIAEPTAFDPA